MDDDEDDWDDAVWSTIDALETSHLQSRQAGPSSFVSTATSDSRWACRSCTLLNSAARAICSVCSTPRGHVYAGAPSAGTAAAAMSVASSPAAVTGAPFWPAQPKKTVQATLPFAKKTGRSTTTTSAVAAAGSRGASVHATQAHRTSGATANVTWPSPAASRGATSSMGTQQSSARGFPVQPQRTASSNHHTEEEIDDPDDDASDVDAAVRLRHKGEDSTARMRYLPASDMSYTQHHPQIDQHAASTFVYPTNYSVREYQLTIAEKALYHNTLVSLPTGLGKTLIASVVMYNFYRWFPQGQIVFMAPTKPLVAQQIGACHEIMGIPLSDTAELQGSVPPAARKVLWSTKRVFFCTPQSMQNDLQRGICRAERLVCLVVDEAHRATGNYAYCGVIQEVEKKTKHFRVLALSATPGAKFEVIQDVICNLRVTHIESRSADDPDVKKYTHARQEEVIKCSLNSQIAESKTLFLRIFDRITQRLLVGNIIQHKDPERLTKWYILQSRDKFRASPNYQSNRSAESDLALLMSLLHGRDLLTGHGLASFKGWLDDFVSGEQEKGKRISWSKRELLQSTEFQALKLSLEHVNGGEDSNSPSHPKLLKLRDVLHEHFQRHAAGQSSTRAIVFTQYRTSVQEIVKLLRPLFPLIKAQQFIGQGSSGKAKENRGQTQKEQQEIVRKFRAGLFNVLVATCIAEEGLDIGEVDLIVSFDALTSPVRMIQRMGRTGRKRVGRVVILVTEGDEEKKLQRSVASAKTVSRALTTFKSKFTYAKCARMIPDGSSPELTALAMDIPEFHASQIAGKQTSSRMARHDPDNTIERRDTWKLNELEKSIMRGKYAAANWSDSARHEFLPIIGCRRILLRRRRTEEQGGPTSARSRALISIIRKLNGVYNDSEEHNIRRSSVKPVLGLRLDACSVVGQQDDEVLDFSDPDDSNECDHQMHFSPPYSGQPPPPEPSTPVRSHGASAQASRSNHSSHHADRSASSPAQIGANGARVSPLRQNTLTGKPSPTSGKRSSAGSGRKSRKRTEKPRDTIDDVLLSRGEELLERLDAMLQDFQSKSELAPPEPEPAIPPDDGQIFSSQFQFPRIARRLIFEKNDESKQSMSDFAAEDDSVPPPPIFTDLFTAHHPVVTDSGTPGIQSVGSESDKSVPISDLSKQMTNADAHETFDLMPDSMGVEVFQGSTNRSTDRHSRVSTDVNASGSPVISEPTKQRGHTHSGVRHKSPSVSGSPKPPRPKRSLALRVPPPDEEQPTTTEGRLPACGPLVMTESCSHPNSGLVEIKPRESRLQVEVNIRPSGRDAHTPDDDQSQRSGSTQGEPCSICCEHESFDDDPIVFCDGCDTAVHQFCYGIPILPDSEWYCDSCEDLGMKEAFISKPKPRRCALCPMRSLSCAMKQTRCGQWVHVQCFMWIPELRFHFESKKLLLGELADIDSDRKTLNCSLCHSKRGYGMIQCAHKRCLNAFHISCASAARDQNYRLVQLDQDEGTEDGTLFIAYCPLHNKSTAIWKSIDSSKKPCHRDSDVKCSSGLSSTPVRTPAPTTVLSPSALLASQGSSSKNERKQFRRLKRKYDSSMFSDATGERKPSAILSPWAKRVKRSQKHAEGKRAQAKAFARMFIDDEVEAPSSGDDDEEIDDMNDEDRDFINDSSQLIYSPSVPTPVREKKNKRNSLGDMRAIYARSLIESPQTPVFLRRGRNNILAGGIINACLQQLNDERDDTDSVPDSGCSLPVRSPDQVAIDTTADVIEIMEATQADPCSVDRVQDAPEVEMVEPSIPSFDLLGIVGAAVSVEVQLPLVKENKPVSESNDKHIGESRLLQEKIEANRLKALQILEAKKLASKRPNVVTEFAPPSVSRSKVHGDPVCRNMSTFDASSPCKTSSPRVVQEQRLDETIGARSLSCEGDTKGIPVYVQPEFRESHIYQVLQGCNTASSERIQFEVSGPIEVSAILSLRVGAVIVELRSVEADLLKHSMVELARVVFQNFLVAVLVRDISIVQRVSQSEAIRQLREIPSCRNVIISSDASMITKALFVVARDEATLGFGLQSLDSTGENPGQRAVDAHFHDRFRFFRSAAFLSIGNAISLSFRFNRFTVKQIPVNKFSEMHWHRMLPWLSKGVAKQLHEHFLHANA